MKKHTKKTLTTPIQTTDIEPAPSLLSLHRDKIVMAGLGLAVIGLFSALIFRSSALTNQFIPLSLTGMTEFTGSVEPVSDANAAGGSYLKFIAANPDPTPPPPGGDASGAKGGDNLTYINESAIPARATNKDGVAWWSDIRIHYAGYFPIDRGDRVGAFRTDCEYSHFNYDDPLVYPGQKDAAHLHMYWGNVSTDYTTDVSNLHLQNHASTCAGGGANRTSYWVPAMIDGNGVPQVPHRIEIYYKTGYRGVSAASVRPFPAGLRMITGNAYSTTPQHNLPNSDNGSFFSCSAGSGATIPNCPAGSEMIWQLEFPQCWDGVNLDSADHKSHMAYANGGCPSSHPVPLTQITYRIFFSAPQGTSGWRLASDINGTQPGSSMHGDWVNGWNRDVLEKWVRNCNNQGVDCHGEENLGDGTRLCAYRYSMPNNPECQSPWPHPIL